MTVIDKARKATAVGATKSKGKPAKGRAASETATVAPAAVESPGRDVLVPLDRLFLGDANVRKVASEHSFPELAALIEAQGLLQRLSVVAQPQDRFAVVAGARRLRAMQMLAEQGRWPATQPVECKVYPSQQAVQVSLAENSGREAIHPADQMEAFKRLIEEEGLTVAQVAGRFGVSVLTVERRLRLARLAPRFLAMYGADQIEPEQLQALALTEDHAAQEAIWDGLAVYDRSAWRIRNAITVDACSADSKLARLVGLDDYEAQGGTVRRDLFASVDDLTGIYLDNPLLLQRLAMDKLRGVVALVKGEGWSWVECVLEPDGATLCRFGREPQDGREPTAEEAEIIERLSAEHRQHFDALEKLQEEGDPDAKDYELVEQQTCEALDAAEQRLSAARQALRQWSPEQLGRCGALVRLDHHGAIVVDRGLVRPQDRKAAAGLSDPGIEPDTHSGRVPVRPEFSETLARDLSSHRTAAIQAALMRNPRVALVALVHRMAETVFELHGRGDDVLKVTVRVTADSTLGQDASDYGASKAANLLGAAQTQWGDRLPGSPAQLFGWLLAQPDQALMELLAYCTARSVNAVVSRARSFNHSDDLAEALGVDMADWWSPSVANYFGRVSRAQALDAIRQATGKDAPLVMSKLKKDELAIYCESLLQGVRWVPAPLRKLAPTSQGAMADEIVND